MKFLAHVKHDFSMCGESELCVCGLQGDAANLQFLLKEEELSEQLSDKQLMKNSTQWIYHCHYSFFAVKGEKREELRYRNYTFTLKTNKQTNKQTSQESNGAIGIFILIIYYYILCVTYYNIFLYNIFILTCLRMAQVQAETCSIRVKAKIRIKINSC